MNERDGLSWRSTAEMYDMKTTQVWKVEGESSDGDYLDGDEFQTEEEAKKRLEEILEAWAVESEYPELVKDT